MRQSCSRARRKFGLVPATGMPRGAGGWAVGGWVQQHTQGLTYERGRDACSLSANISNHSCDPR